MYSNPVSFIGRKIANGWPVNCYNSAGPLVVISLAVYKNIKQVKIVSSHLPL